MAGGDELVLHGWSHRAGPEGGRFRRAVGRAVARGAAEFAALDEEEAGRRLADARSVLAGLDLSVSGFTPPGWLASPAANRALVRSGFRYTTTHFGVRDLHSGRLHSGFALSHRPSGGSRLVLGLMCSPGRWVGHQGSRRASAGMGERVGAWTVREAPAERPPAAGWSGSRCTRPTCTGRACATRRCGPSRRSWWPVAGR